ncbi:MAG: hypothetical protein J3R72DRAFT_164585 [Linnemannia gamsii]|nr:MAG: hypothetical protein J3R72DRAFT_164585 [Linnemannia gamsii]
MRMCFWCIGLLGWTLVLLCFFSIKIDVEVFLQFNNEKQCCTRDLAHLFDIPRSIGWLVLPLFIPILILVFICPTVAKTASFGFLPCYLRLFSLGWVALNVVGFKEMY